jgi:hypothetical protein
VKYAWIARHKARWPITLALLDMVAPITIGPRRKTNSESCIARENWVAKPLRQLSVDVCGRHVRSARSRMT